jgi:hypothetical protein
MSPECPRYVDRDGAFLGVEHFDLHPVQVNWTVAPLSSISQSAPHV